MPLSRIKLLSLLGALTLSAGCAQQATEPATTPDPDQQDWVDLFNGENLDQWVIKINGFPAGENHLDTFRVEDGKLVASYENYEQFDGRFGHIFYEQPFSHYIIEVEYRFVGEQVPEAPDWAWRNNGIMYHAQSPYEMGLNQAFPACMEVQLLGGQGHTPRATANLVTPGTHAVVDGELREDHIIESSSETYHGDQWVTVEVEVHGNELAIHRVEGEEVIRYSGMQLDDGTPLKSGYIALQAESSPTEFRSVKLLNLEGCMDQEAENYKSYFVKDDPEACRY